MLFPVLLALLNMRGSITLASKSSKLVEDVADGISSVGDLADILAVRFLHAHRALLGGDLTRPGDPCLTIEDCESCQRTPNCRYCGETSDGKRRCS